MLHYFSTSSSAPTSGPMSDAAAFNAAVTLMSDEPADKNYQTFESLIKQQPHVVNFKDQADITLLHFAVLKDLVTFVALLIKKTVAVNVADCNGSTPLHIATQYNRKAIAALLLNAGAKQQADKQQNYPVHFAALHADSDFINLLIKAGADINAVNHLGQTAAHIALSAKQLNTFSDIALLHKADLTIKDETQESAWNYLSKQLSPEEFNKFEFLYAAAHGAANKVKELFDKGKEIINSQDYLGNSALLVAAYNGQIAMVQWLLAHGASLKETNDNGATALLVAAYNGQIALGEWLLAHGASLSETNKFGNTALLLAAYNQQFSVNIF